MSRGSDRDASVERLLRQSLKARAGAVPQDPCLDAEKLAAWVDGTLVGDQLAATESHLSDCGRCLTLLAKMVKTAPAVAPAERWWGSGTLRWLVPLMAGAAAVVIWIAVPNDERSRSPEQTVARTEGVPATPPAQAPPAGQQSLAAGADEKLQATLEPVGRRDERARAKPEQVREVPRESSPTRPEPAAVDDFQATGRTERASPAPPPPAAAAPGADRAAAVGALEEKIVTGETPAAPAPPAAAAAPAAARSADSLRRSNAAALTSATPIEIVSPDTSIRWRVGPRGFVQLSRDRGVSWEPLSSGVTTDLMAGASPSPSVCWLVGRAGTVLLTTDGRTWQRVTFPEAVDLATVRATDARTATVTTADGRTFATTDGGRTWNR